MSVACASFGTDYFNGTGTTAIAAKRLGRNFIGFEVDSEYVKITKNKLKKEKSNSKIGNIWVSCYLNKVVTLRNEDWEALQKYFYIPKNIKEIDHFPIILKNKFPQNTIPKNNFIQKDLFPKK